MSESGDSGGALFTMNLPKFISVSFDPLIDITAYELAKLLPFFHGRSMTEDAFKELGTASRHLKRHD